MELQSKIKSGGKRILPDPVLFTISQEFFRWYAKVMTWYASGRKYSANIDPSKLLRVDPQTIDSVIVKDGRAHFEYSDVVSEVVDGPWDRKTIPLEEYDLYKAFEERFINGARWEETEFFRRAEKIFSEDKEKWGCGTLDEFRERLDRMDALYRSIKEDGYRTQQELRKSRSEDPALRRIHKYWPPEFHEVSLVISRDGELIVFEGRHRLSIARIVGIEEIPVRIKGRHKQWQDRREEQKRATVANLDHPDLGTL